MTQSPPSTTPPAASADSGVNWSWAAYVASSWTWCIGMFLPVLLVRDFGLWGWVAFAVPNVIGAAMVGRWNYQLPDGQSLLERHRPALMWFSTITIAFHVFFMAWMVHRLIGPWVMPAFGLAVIFFAILIKLGKATTGAWIALLVSLLAGGVFLAAHGAVEPPAVRISPGETLGLLCLTPAIALGFVLCPHMDLTLLRARHAMPAEQARITFAAGFFGLFLLLISFTLVYGNSLRLTLATGNDLLLPAAVAGAIGIHMSVQGAFTSAVHANEVIGRMKRRTFMRSLMTFGLAMIALWLASRSIVPGSRLLGYDPGEVVYRLFISFYGLVFPAYAWAAWLWRRQPALPAIAWLAPVLLTLPMFAAGFLARQTMWIVPGVLLVLLLPWVTRPRATTASK